MEDHEGQNKGQDNKGKTIMGRQGEEIIREDNIRCSSFQMFNTRLF